jgi:hypothetical protein
VEEADEAAIETAPLEAQAVAAAMLHQQGTEAAAVVVQMEESEAAPAAAAPPEASGLQAPVTPAPGNWDLEEELEPMPEEAVLEVSEPRLAPSPIVFDPLAEPPPLPDFFLERALTQPAPIFHMDEPARPQPRAPARAAAATRPPQNLAEAAASLRRSHTAHLLAGLGIPESPQPVLDFGLPTVGEDELPPDEHAGQEFALVDEGAEPFEVRVGALGWTGVFRREVESGRPCSLLLRGPQYSFLTMAEPGEPLRGLPLFALFAIGAVSAPGKEALRGGATFIFQGRKASGDWAVEVRPRRRRPAEKTTARAKS